MKFIHQDTIKCFFDNWNFKFWTSSLALMVLLFFGFTHAEAQNTPPEAENDYRSIPQNKTLELGAPGILANDSDSDGDALTVSLVTDVEHGDLSLEQSGALEYTPETDFMGSDSLDYSIEDAAGAKDTARLYIQVHEPFGEIGFMRSGQEETFAHRQTTAVIGDLDGDRDLDIITHDGEVGYSDSPNPDIHIYLNDGAGIFTETDQVIEFSGRVSPANSILADVDGDNDLDYLFAGDSHTRLYLNDGDAYFTESAAELPDTDNGDAAFADIDNDYDQDLVLSGVEENDALTTKVLLNDGEGNFTDSNAGLNGLNEGDLALADFDQDGNVDILSNGYDDDFKTSTVLYFGNGDATFSENQASFYDLGDGTISTGDVNGDGYPDFLISGYDSQQLTFLYTYSDNRSFELSRNNFSGIGANDYPDYEFQESALNDVDGDGDTDIVLSGSSTTMLYMNTGSGNFTSRENPFEEGTNYAAFRDIDGDYDNDVILGHYEGVTIYPNRSIQSIPNREPLFIDQFPSEIDVVAGDTYSNTAYLGDPDGDSLSLELTGDISADNFSYSDSSLGSMRIAFEPTREQTGFTGEFTLEISDGVQTRSADFNLNVLEHFYLEEKDLTQNSNNSAYGIADLNNDDYPDIITSDTGTDSTVVSINNGDGTYTQREKKYPSIESGSISFGDINNDGNQDMLISGSNDSENINRVYQGDGRGDLIMVDTDLKEIDGSNTAIRDFNGDGNADLYINGFLPTSSQSGTKIETHIYFGDGEDGFSLSENELSGSVGRVSFSDIDNDGDLDYIKSGEKLIQSDGFTAPKPVINLYLNDGNGIFSKESVDLPALTKNDIATADLDGDGDSDLILSGSAENEFVSEIYFNDGSGNFSKASENTLADLTYSQIGVADFENDGDQDIVLKGEHSERGDLFELYLNDGKGNFSKLNGGLEADYESIFFFHDLDKDADSDILVLEGNDSWSYENLGSAGTVSTDEKTSLPNKISLKNNYPNPFNPTTNIQYSVPNTGEVKLQVFDILGRKVQTLVNDQKTAGQYTVSFNAKNLSSGIYIYRLKVGSKVLTKKMSLIK